MSTGAYVRIERDGPGIKWKNIVIEELTDAERKTFFKGRDSEEMIRWINMLCNKVEWYNKMSGGPL